MGARETLIMEELGLVHGNTVLDLRARFPSIDGAAGTTDHAIIKMNGIEVWRCLMTYDQLLLLPLIRHQLFSNAFLLFRPYHEPAAINFWESWTSDFALTASTKAAEHRTGLELIAEIRTDLSVLPDHQLELELVDQVLLVTWVDVAVPTATEISIDVEVDVEVEMVRYDDGFLERACPICLDDFNMGMEVAKMPCTHVFHKHCIVRWLEQSFRCPICRSHVLHNNCS